MEAAPVACSGGASRKEKRKALKKVKRKQLRKEAAIQEREEEEARSNDPEEQLRIRQREQEEAEAAERERKAFEERERLWVEAAVSRKAEEEAYAAEEEERRKKLLEEEEKHKMQSHELEEDDEWEYIEEGPAEIIWQGNEIIVKKKKVKVKRGDRKQVIGEVDERPTTNPLPPQSALPPVSAQEVLEKVAQEVPNFGTEQDKAHCPFHLKTGACRFGSRCSRIHFYPDKSCTLLIKNMYNGPGLALEQDEGLETEEVFFTFISQSCVPLTKFLSEIISRCTSWRIKVFIFFEAGESLNIPLSIIFYLTAGGVQPNEDNRELLESDEEVDRCYEEFYEDVHTEFQKFGEIVNFKVCKNGSYHLRGNVYVHYKSLDSAVLAYNNINGRYYGGKQITCEFVSVLRWKVAICGEFLKSRLKTCSHGSACNFIHCFRNPGGDYEWADWDNPPPRFWLKKMVALFGPSDESNYGRLELEDSDKLTNARRKRERTTNSRYHSRSSNSNIEEHDKSSLLDNSDLIKDRFRDRSTTRNHFYRKINETGSLARRDHSDKKKCGKHDIHSEEFGNCSSNNSKSLDHHREYEENFDDYHLKHHQSMKSEKHLHSRRRERSYTKEQTDTGREHEPKSYGHEYGSFRHQDSDDNKELRHSHSCENSQTIRDDSERWREGHDSDDMRTNEDSSCETSVQKVYNHHRSRHHSSGKDEVSDDSGGNCRSRAYKPRIHRGSPDSVCDSEGSSKVYDQKDRYENSPFEKGNRSRKYDSNVKRKHDHRRVEYKDDGELSYSDSDFETGKVKRSCRRR